MIRLMTEPYCENCPNFKAVSNTSTIQVDNEKFFTESAVRCENADRCREIANYLEGNQ